MIDNINNVSFTSRRLKHVPKNEREMFAQFRRMVAKQAGGKCPEILEGDVFFDGGGKAKIYIGSRGVTVEPSFLREAVVARFKENFFASCTKGKYEVPTNNKNKKVSRKKN